MKEEIERKFLVEPPVDITALGPHSVLMIEQYYLPHTNGKKRYRRTLAGEEISYTETIKQRRRPIARGEAERSIGPEEYEAGKARMLPGSQVIRKERLVFVYDGQTFELDRFIEPAIPYHILEIELDHDHQDVRLPEFLTIVREVTHEKEWGNYRLAFR